MRNDSNYAAEPRSRLAPEPASLILIAMPGEFHSIEDTIFVIGHKNPDTDSICSAIGYAAYKQATGESGYVAARCGNSNPRIDAVLKRFGVPLPVFIGDVTPRVRDIMKRKPHCAKLSDTCSEALEAMDKYDFRALPVVDEADHLKGLISIFHLGQYFTPQVRNPLEMRRVRSRVSDIIRALKAKVIHSIDTEREEELFVRVGAMDIRSFDLFHDEKTIPAKSSIVVVGDRWDIQEKSIQLGVRLLVITGNLKVEKDIIERAIDKGISLVVSPYDTATTSWIIRSATSIRHIADPVAHSFRESDTLSMVKRRILEQVAPLYTVIGEDDRLIGVFSKSDLLRPVKTRIALVDHNEMSQAVDGAREVQIVEIIDHHRLGNPGTEQPVLFINQPVGSTSTIVADLFRRSGLTPDPATAGLLMAGLISDTLHLASPTTTSTDRDHLSWLSEIAKTDPSELAQLIFNSGSVLLEDDPEKIILMDCKTYDHGNLRFSVSQIEELGFDNLWKRYDVLMRTLESHRRKNNLTFSGLLVTDINHQDSLFLITGDASLVESISYPRAKEHGVFEMKDVVSRKKQLIPYLSSCMKSIGILP